MWSLFKTCFCVSILFMQTTVYAQSDFLSARDSEPSKLGWMQGFPIPATKQLRFNDGSFFEFPAMRWSVVHMRDLMPTVNVSRGLAAPSKQAKQLDPAIDAITFRPLKSNKDMSWEASLWQNYTVGIVVLHRGKIVYERYFAELTEDQQHAAMSVTKSLTGTLGAVLVAEGKLDDKRLVSEYLPELKDSAFGDATVRQVLDMTTSVKFSEDYAN